MGMTVLLVDDEAVFRNYVKDMNFWREEMFVLEGEARNTEEALVLLNKKEVDIVILDITMPGRNGVELSAVIAEKHPAIAMIAVSSYDTYDYVREILKNGAHDYILKGRLSEELLYSTLANLRKKLLNRSPWEIKAGVREQAKGWLFDDKVNPFTAVNGKKLALIVKLFMEDTLSDSGKNAIMEGIGKILEDMTCEQMDSLALLIPSNQFVVFIRCYDTVSEEEMRRQLECGLTVAKDSVKKIYGIHLHTFFCPVFFNDNALRSFILHKIQEKQSDEEIRSSQLALTISQQKKLLATVEHSQAENAEMLVKEIYDQIPEGKEWDGKRMMVTKELLELIEKIAQEYQIELSFLPRDFMLYQYTRHKDKDKLSAVISGLYLNVLREIRGKCGNKQYSAVVMGALTYLQKNYENPIGLSAVSEALGVNGSYLSRVFHEETKKTVTEYLNGVRIQAAKQLIEEGRLPLKEIVSRCGFNHYGYFIKTFKEYTGKTPKEYGQTK